MSRHFSVHDKFDRPKEITDEPIIFHIKVSIKRFTEHI